MEISRQIPEFARADARKKPDLVALADASKRGIGGAEARRHGVHHEDTAGAANARAAEAREEAALRARDAREQAQREGRFDVEV